MNGSRIRVTRHADPRAFLEAAEAGLLRAEAENGLLLAFVGRLPRDPAAGEPSYLATLHAGDEWLGCAIRPPGQKLLMSRLPAAAIAALVADLDGCGEQLPGVLGPEPEVTAFSRAWSECSGQPSSLAMNQRIYGLEQLLPQPRCAPGRLRPALAADLELVTRWSERFTLDAIGEPALGTEAEEAERIRRGALFLWEDGKPVSMAGWAGKTPNAIRINQVYTPSELRGRGYAAACVGALSQRLLASGNRFCFLYADLANATSNRVYQRLGYRPVADWGDYRLAPRPPTR